MIEAALITLHPRQYRDLVAAWLESGDIAWEEAFIMLFNGGWRGPYDATGLPTSHD